MQEPTKGAPLHRHHISLYVNVYWVPSDLVNRAGSQKPEMKRACGGCTLQQILHPEFKELPSNTAHGEQLHRWTTIDAPSKSFSELINMQMTTVTQTPLYQHTHQSPHKRQKCDHPPSLPYWFWVTVTVPSPSIFFISQYRMAQKYLLLSSWWDKAPLFSCSLVSLRTAEDQ